MTVRQLLVCLRELQDEDSSMPSGVQQARASWRCPPGLRLQVPCPGQGDPTPACGHSGHLLTWGHHRGLRS